MSKSLSPRDAAEALGISPDTLRRWERGGLIESNRTPGGQRRYDESDVLALLDRERRPAPRPQRRLPTTDFHDVESAAVETKPEVQPPVIPSYERRVREERANLEVLKLRMEEAALVRVQRTARDQREREAVEKERLAREQEAERERRAKNEAVEKERLDRLRAYGRAQAVLAPSEYQAKVARDLLSSITGSEYPAELPIYLAYAQISERVTEVLKPWRDSEERERRRLEVQSKVSAVISSARWYAFSETRELDSEIRDGAQREIERALKEEVEEDWTIDDAKDLIHEILDDWCD